MIRTTPRIALLSLALALVVAIPAAARPTDMRTPDTRDLATQVSTFDLRSPDSVDRAASAEQVPASEVSSGDSTDWGYFAGGGILLVALAGGAVAFMWRRRTMGATVAH